MGHCAALISVFFFLFSLSVYAPIDNEEGSARRARYVSATILTGAKGTE
jgi:hypothetical protein